MSLNRSRMMAAVHRRPTGLVPMLPRPAATPAHPSTCGSGRTPSPQPPSEPGSARIDAALAPDELVQRLVIRLVRCRVPQDPRPFAPGSFVGFGCLVRMADVLGVGRIKSLDLHLPTKQLRPRAQAPTTAAPITQKAADVTPNARCPHQIQALVRLHQALDYSVLPDALVKLEEL
jgi:hypothetical protein